MYETSCLSERNRDREKGARTMKLNKLVAQFAENPTKENALKVIRHTHKHPMSLCFLDEYEHANYQYAQAVILDD